MDLRTRFVSAYPLISITVVSLLLAVSAFAANPIPQVVGPPIPQAVVPGSGVFTLKVYGANFVSGAVVNWNRSPRSTTFISARELRAKILASDVATATAGYITVTNPPPGGGVSSSSYALVEVHAPTRTINPGPPTQYLDGQISTAAITADFTGDGILDLVAGFNPLYFNRGNGDGTFHAGYTIAAYYADEGAIAFGDFTGEGKLDLVYAWTRDDTNFYLKALLGKGNGRFASGVRFKTASGLPIGLVAGDFNGDGKLDLATAEEVGPDIGAIFLGNGDGTFKKRATYNLLSGPLAVADLNGDGKLDLIWNLFGSVYVRMGNGDGTFQKQRRIAHVQVGDCLAVNDFNGDGIVDIAFADIVKEQIGVLMGKGDGTFNRPVFYPVGFPQGDFKFVAGDFNSDGKTDLIATQAGIQIQNVILLGRGDGTFEKAQNLELPGGGAGEDGIIVGDLNSDGLLDFVYETAMAGLWVYVQQ